MRFRLVVPHQEQISGGRVYNTELSRALRSRGWEIEELSIAGAWPWPAADARRRVRDALLAGPQPVVVDGLVGAACPQEIAYAVAGGATVIVLVHLPLPTETGLTPPEQAELADGERRALHAASLVVATSHWAAADLEARYGLSAVRAVVPGNRPASLAAGSRPPMLIMVGAFTPMKNHATVLTALDRVGDLPWQAVLIGAPRNAQIMAEVRRHLRTSPQASRIEVTGEVSGEALEQAWHSSDLLLLPSWMETYGMVVTEALARGVPAVVARSHGAVEALSGVPRGDGVADSTADELAGALADPGDPEEWAHLLRGWLTNPDQRERWQHEARRRRTELRSWADTAHDFEHILEELS